MSFGLCWLRGVNGVQMSLGSESCTPCPSSACSFAVHQNKAVLKSWASWILLVLYTYFLVEVGGDFSFSTTCPNTTCQDFLPPAIMRLVVVFLVHFSMQLLFRHYFLLAESFREGIWQVSPWKVSFGRIFLNIHVLLRKSPRLSYLSHQLFHFPVNDFLRSSGWTWLASQ